MKFSLIFAVPLLLWSGVVSAQDATSNFSSVPTQVCEAKLVFLGEASHGGGQAIATKAELAKTLITRCGFRQIAFESQIYDFASLSKKNIQLSEFRNAVGGLWSTAAETDELFQLLVELANVGKINLLGIDGQIGSATSRYTKAQFAKDMTVNMDQESKLQCNALINRLANWEFDDANPKDANFDTKLKTCAGESINAAKRTNKQTSIRLAENFLRFLSFSQDDYFNDRDRLMAENLQQALSDGLKTIVWTANVHASRSATNKAMPVASYYSKSEGVVSIAVTAIEGEYCLAPCKNLKTLAMSSAGSLESKIQSADQLNSLVPLNKLLGMSNVPSKLFDYAKEANNDWAAMFDYVIVLPKERRPTHVRPARPL